MKGLVETDELRQSQQREPCLGKGSTEYLRGPQSLFVTSKRRSPIENTQGYWQTEQRCLSPVPAPWAERQWREALSEAQSMVGNLGTLPGPDQMTSALSISCKIM